jgi:enterochelin esterase-like enzyme
LSTPGFRLPRAGVLLATFLLLGTNALADGSLSADTRIASDYLGYALQYRVYTPAQAGEATDLPTIYITDGQWYIEPGGTVGVLDREIAAGNIEPVIAVFIDSRNPDNLAENRRNQEFMCNERYVAFVTRELIPAISASFPVSEERGDRVIAGMSFGGLNAACFGLMAADYFSGVGMQSPASDLHLEVLEELYDEKDPTPVSMFFSVGTRRDNTKAARRFYRTLEKKGYPVNYMEVPFGHDWSNWHPLLDDLLATFFATEP